MENKTIYTYDLLLKMNLMSVAKSRQKISRAFIVCIIVSVVTLLLFIFNKSYILMFLCGFYIAISLFFLVSLSTNRKKKLQQAVKKSIEENQNKITEYQFEEDCITVNQTSEFVQSNYKIAYSYISKVEKMDDNSFYFSTKGNLYYVLYDEQGIEKYFLFMCEKTKVNG